MRQSNIQISSLRAFNKFYAEVNGLKSARLYLQKIELIGLKEGGHVLEAQTYLTKTIPSEYGNALNYFEARLFLSAVASFELYLQEQLASVIAQYPRKVGSVQFRLSDILDANGTDSLVQSATDSILLKLMYKKPLEYLEEFTDTLSIECAPLLPGWKVFIEAKARRDLGSHNGWKCNSTYTRKLSEAGIETSMQNGSSALPVDRKYFDEVLTELLRLAELIDYALHNKYAPPVSDESNLFWELLKTFP